MGLDAAGAEEDLDAFGAQGLDAAAERGAVGQGGVDEGEHDGRIDLRAVTVTERKASLLIDVARAFFQWGKYEQALAALRAAEDTAPQEVAARPSVGTLARDLATLAPASIRRNAEQFATRIGATK